MTSVSKCCGAMIRSTLNGYVICCQCCGVVLDICKDVISQETPSIEIIEMPAEPLIVEIIEKKRRTNEEIH